MHKQLLDDHLKKHIDVLKNNVFHIHDKWPQFNLLLEDLFELQSKINKESVVVSMERTLLYGGYSLFAPFFSNKNFISLDCSPESADSRKDYNRHMVDHPDFIKIPYSKRASFEDIELENETIDVLLIPNLVHHVKNQALMFEQASRILKKGGLIYIFEPLVRELHQIPDDYLRYTPFGLENILTNYGFANFDIHYTGGPFSVLSYVWTQALEYLPSKEREEVSKWFYSSELDRLHSMDQKYKKNLVRKNTSFPSAFSIKATKV